MINSIGSECKKETYKNKGFVLEEELKIEFTLTIT